MATQKTRDKIIDAFLQLAAERSYSDVSLERIAERAGTSLKVLRGSYDSRTAILADFLRRTDELVLAELDPDLVMEARRERLFDILLSRFEALLPSRDAVRGLAGSALRDPLLALELNRLTTTSMGWMLNAAGITASGPAGMVRAQGLTLIWGAVMRVWLRDDDPGMARTMAELDRRLKDAERNATRLDRLGNLVSGLIPRLPSRLLSPPVKREASEPNPQPDADEMVDAG
ncbi:transcriptional regulator, TetR family [Faunimonas pinastri]|uniref:Transcriptional regulator, TetR family n=1 Tax=Faunimonas pinastri TaxID=1855383 RepID=A0A1H9ATK1_9HYPH|nr:TetR/AcrR family transcriptional regulator [Faunimonas pinastri]SEP79723.1 transcriptional regulator, TetR family [Faunimonas pinastri]